MNNAIINLDKLNDADRATVLSILKKSEKSNTGKPTNYSGIKDGETFMIGDMEFIKFPSVNGETPIVMRGCAFTSRFGDNNDLRYSNVMKKMYANILPKVIAEIGEENLCTVKTDLTTLDGLNPYGVMESLISLPTFDFYRANVAIFDKYKVNKYWWTATPESARPHDEPNWVVCVAPSGCIGNYDGYFGYGGSGVRPLLLLKSSIFVSLDD